MSNKPSKASLHHIALAVHNLDESFAFYKDVVELEPLETPQAALDNGIRWFDLGDGCALHLIEVADVKAPPRAHLAFSVKENDKWRAFFEAKGVEFVEPKVQLYAAKRFFFKDPSGNLIEYVEWLEES